MIDHEKVNKELEQKYLDYAKSTGPMNRERVEAAISQLYDAAGMPPPKEFIYVGSPAQLAAFDHTMKQVEDPANSTNSVREAITKVCCEKHSMACISLAVYEGPQSIGDLNGLVGENILTPLISEANNTRNWPENLLAEIGSIVAAKTAKTAKVDLPQMTNLTTQATCTWGHMDWGHVALDKAVVTADDPIDVMQQVAEQFPTVQSEYDLHEAGFWQPYREFAVISERPVSISLDDEGRLHNDDNAAILYPDGWGVYAVGGVIVDEQIVMRPETQTIKQITDEENEEVKRVRIEKFGWNRFIAETDAEVADSRVNPIENTKEMLIKSAEANITALVCHCTSTARVYALEVPPSTTSCEEAQTWLWANDRTRYEQPRIIGRS